MSRTYTNCKLLINANRYEYEDMYNKLDLFLMMGRITEEEYVELTGMLTLPEVPVEPEPPAEQPVEQPEQPPEEPATDEIV